MSISTAGLTNKPTINGVDVGYPAMLSYPDEPIQARQEVSGGRTVFTALHPADYYPNVSERRTFSLEFELGDESNPEDGVVMAFIRRLKRRGGAHRLALWFQDVVYWTGAEGQSLFYLPRQNAPSVMPMSSRGESDLPVTFRSSTDDGVTWTDNPWTVVMKTSVASTDTPGASEIWVGQNRLCKIGTALTAETLVECLYYPLHRVVITDAPSNLRNATQEEFLLNFAETVES